MPASTTTQTYSFDAGIVLAPAGQRNLILLNETAGHIWRSHQGKQSPEVIAEQIAHNFDICPSAALADIKQQLKTWKELGLLNAARDVSAESSNINNISSNTPPQAIGNGDVFTYQIGGQRIGIVFATQALKSIVHPVFAHLETEYTSDTTVLTTTEQGGDYRLFCGEHELACETDAQEIAAILIRRAQVAAIENSDAGMIIHGAAVALGDKCMVFPGLSGCGKSTLAAALAWAGFTLLGDDVLILDKQKLQIQPVPLSLNLKTGSLPALQARIDHPIQTHKVVSQHSEVHYLTPPGFHPSLQEQMYTVTGFVFPQYCAEGAEPTVQRLRASEVLCGLLQSHSTLAPGLKTGETTALLKWLEKTPGHHLNYHSLDGAIGEIRQLFREA